MSEVPPIRSADLFERLTKLLGSEEEATDAMYEKSVTGAVRVTGVGKQEPYGRQEISRDYWLDRTGRPGIKFRLGYAWKKTGRSYPKTIVFEDLEFNADDVVCAWPRLAGRAPTPLPPSADELLGIVERTSDGVLTETAVLERVKKEIAPRPVPSRMWRDAWNNPRVKKRLRGKKPTRSVTSAG
jgi:hypothetical protein